MTHPPDEHDRLVEALANLPHAEPPATLEDRLIGALRARGDIRPRRRAGLILLGTAALAAAAATLWLASRPEEPRGEPEYLLLIAEGRGYQAPADPAAQEALVREFAAWAGELARAGRLVSAGELEPAGAVVSAAGSTTLDTGARSAATGYFIIHAGSTEEAERLARRSPHLRLGGTVVVRPVVRQD